MFYQIGKKIKNLATLVTVIGMVISIISGIIIISVGIYSAIETSNGKGALVPVLIGLAVGIIGSLIAWLMSFLLYGYGELIDETSRLATHFCGENASNTGSAFFGKAITIDNVTQKNNGSSFGSALSIPNKNQEENK